jgi:flavin reductase (DIM6/NTAB) family NADH-FMN oxidoreductase RutF
MVIELKNISSKEKMDLLQHAIAPRPIGLVSTIDKNGNPNLSPFSYFNLFSSNPPIVIFSPVRKIRNGGTKHTRENIYQVPEVVIHIVDFDMVQQVNLASAEFEKDVNEFDKAGFSPEPATMVRPLMVKESPVKLECKIKQIKPLGDKGGAGTLIICEVLVMHIHEKILNAEGKIDQRKLQHVARLGADWYCKISEENLFKIPKPQNNLPMGIDNLPEFIVRSNYLTGNHLALLAGVPQAPERDSAFRDERLEALLLYLKGQALSEKLHEYAKELMEDNKIAEAWQVLLRQSAAVQNNNASAHAI